MSDSKLREIAQKVWPKPQYMIIEEQAERIAELEEIATEYDGYRKETKERIAELEAENQRYKEAMEPLEGRSPLAAMKYIDHLEQTTKRLWRAAQDFIKLYEDAIGGEDRRYWPESLIKLAELLEVSDG